jgi:predicted metal-dependent hydrolase
MKPQGTQLSLFETRSSSDPFAVRISPRARRLTARVHVGGRVEIVVPLGVNAHTVRDFVQRFTPWIDRKVAAMQCFAAPSEPVPATVEFALTREKFAVDWQRGGKRRLEQTADRIVVQAPDERGARALLQRWLKRAAYQRLAPRLLQLAGELNYSVACVFPLSPPTPWGRRSPPPSAASARAGAAARRAAP